MLNMFYSEKLCKTTYPEMSGILIYRSWGLFRRFHRPCWIDFVG
jgi:hypothetical protein